MKIVADDKIPCAKQAFSQLGKVKLIPGREIQNNDLLDCDCLVVRTVTRVDKTLLNNTNVKFIGSCTIGTDHIDLDYLASQNITFANAAGCNAEAASEYVISGLFALSKTKDFDPLKLKAGIIGYGNVGSKLCEKLEILGIKCLVNDPPLETSGKSSRQFVSLDTLIEECDFISLHVPLSQSGEHKTQHLFDANRLAHLRQGCLLVNAARGGVIDNQALIELLKDRKDLSVFLDTWENEPNISKQLLGLVDLATPHIAGYSVEGRLRATQMILDAANKYFGQSSDWNMEGLIPAAPVINLNQTDSVKQFWQQLFQHHFDIWRDHKALLMGVKLEGGAFTSHFDQLRRVYPDRLEYPRFKLTGESQSIDNPETSVAQPITQLGKLKFQV